jgi:hypothetical protein
VARGVSRSKSVVIHQPTKVVPAVQFPTWEAFRAALSGVLSRMAVDTYLVLNVRPAEADSLHYVQFAQSGRSGFLAEAVSNRNLVGRSALSPQQEEQLADLGWQFPAPRSTSDVNFSRQWPMPVPFDDVAALAVRTLREVYGANETSDLVYQRFARGGHAFAQPELGIDSMAPAVGTSSAKSITPSLETLRPLVEGALRKLLNLPQITYDDDGDIPIRFGSAMVYLRMVDGRPPSVRLFSPVLWNIPSSAGLLDAINEINTRIRFGRVTWTGREVMASIEIPVFHLSAEDIGFACLQLGNVSDHFDGELQQRFGGSTMFESSREIVH